MRRLTILPVLLLALLVGQTGGTIPSQVYTVVQALAPILSALVVIVILIALPMLIFRVLLGEVLSKI